MNWNEIKGEISGFGGAYEAACRKMTEAGVDYLKNNPIGKFKHTPNIFPNLWSDDEDSQAFEKAIAKGCPDGNPSGAMVGAAINHSLYIHKNGWDKYKEEMNK